MSQHALWPDPHFTDDYHVGDEVTSSLTTNEGTVVHVAAGRHLLIRWQRPSVHVTRHHSPLGLVKA